MKQYRKTIRTALMGIAILLIAAGAISIATSGIASAKYTQQKVAQSVPVLITVDADLAGTLEVLEHKATRKDSGVYSLGDEEVSANEYHLMPGVDVPKDPFVKITGKTEIPAYVYIEVVDHTQSTFTYTINSTDWLLQTGCTGRNGGTVYAYKETVKKTAENGGNLTLPILSGDHPVITVSHELSLDSTQYSNAGLDFYAYMAQAVEGKTAENIYNSQIARS